MFRLLLDILSKGKYKTIMRHRWNILSCLSKLWQIHPLSCPQKIRKLLVLPKNAPPTPENLHVLPENVFSKKMTCIAWKCLPQKMTGEPDVIVESKTVLNLSDCIDFCQVSPSAHLIFVTTAGCVKHRHRRNVTSHHFFGNFNFFNFHFITR